MSQPPIGMILAAGRGTRMLPLTRQTPKPLLPFLNRPILSYTLGLFREASVDRIGINLHHLANAFEAQLERLAGDLRVRPVHEAVIRDSGGGIAGLWRALGSPDTTAIVCNSDTVMDVDLAKLLARHRASGAAITLVTRPQTTGHPGGVFVAGEQVVGLRHVRVAEATEEREFMGIHLIETEALETIDEVSGDGSSSIVGDIYIPWLERGRTIRAELVDDFWVALDNPGLLLEATRSVLDAPSAFAHSGLRTTRGGLHVSPEANVDPGASLRGPVVIGPRARIASGTIVGPYAVVDGVEIATGAEVENAVLFDVGAVEGVWRSRVAVAQEVSDPQ